MTNRDRDGVATLIKQVIARLEAAPAEADARAQAAAKEGRVTSAGYHLAGGLEETIKQEVFALRSIVENCLTAKAPKPRVSARGKR